MRGTFCNKIKQSLYWPVSGREGSRRLRLPRFRGNRHMKVVRLLALLTGNLYAQGNIPGNRFY